MEKIKTKKKFIALQKSFILYVLVTFALVIVLSGAVIWGCLSVRAWLLPDSDEVFLNIDRTGQDGTTESESVRMKLDADPGKVGFLYDSQMDLDTFIKTKYSISSIETSFSSLSPKRQLLYRGCGSAMVALPIAFSLLGILACGFLFYRNKLKKPIGILASATEKIAQQDLDFEVVVPSRDELGMLCDSFEKMRCALQENNRKMWAMLEERKNLQASVAHDLRNPIAIIEGHAEYLQLNLPAGNLDSEKILSIAGNIGKAAKRLERYTESIRAVNHLEELDVVKKPVDFAVLYEDMMTDLARMAQARNITVCSENLVPAQTIYLDSQVLYRILENLTGNSVRFAKSRLCFTFSYSDSILTVCAEDDGPGFSAKLLKTQNRYFFSDGSSDLHAGMGLTICQILCKKHGGSLSLGNSEAGGAKVQLTLFA